MIENFGDDVIDKQIEMSNDETINKILHHLVKVDF